jgi:hypothetical protein
MSNSKATKVAGARDESSVRIRKVGPSRRPTSEPAETKGDSRTPLPKITAVLFGSLGSPGSAPDWRTSHGRLVLKDQANLVKAPISSTRVTAAFLDSACTPNVRGGG